MRDALQGIRWLWRALRASGLAHGANLCRFAWLSLRHGLSPYTLAALWARVTPASTAITDDSGTLTWRELLASVNALVVAFDSMDIRAGGHNGHGRHNGHNEHNGHDRHGKRIGILCRNHRGFVQALLALMRLGVDIVLINTRFDARQLDEVLNRHCIDTLILDRQFDGQIGQTSFKGRCIYSAFLSGMPMDTADHADNAECADNTALHRPIDQKNPAVTRSPASVAHIARQRMGALIVLTSGTTGSAQGVRRRPTPMQLAGIIYSLITRLNLRTGSRTFITVPLFHGYGIAAVALAMGLRAPIALTLHTDGPTLRKRACAFGTHTLITVPTLLRRMLDADSVDPADSVNPISAPDKIQRIISGSAPLSMALVRDTHQQFGPVLYNLYGSTQAGLIAIADPTDLGNLNNPDNHDGNNESDKAPTTATVGYPVHGTQVAIRTAAGDTRASGIIGEIIVTGGLSISTTGTTDTTGTTAAANVTNASNTINANEKTSPLKNATRAMIPGTGDRGYLDANGRLFLLGRMDEMIIVGGENIYPQPVEDRLRMLAPIADAAVVGIDDGAGGQRLAAWLVLRAGYGHTGIDATDLAASFATVLPPYMRPARWRFIDQLPRNAIGKLQRNQLPVF